MKLAASFFCDAASVREGLLHVLGAGISTFTRSAFPGPTHAMYAGLVQLDPGDIGAQHSLRFVMAHGQDADGEVILDFDGVVESSYNGPVPLGPSTVPIVVDLRDFLLPSEGSYTLRVFIDGKVVGETPILAVLSEA